MKLESDFFKQQCDYFLFLVEVLGNKLTIAGKASTEWNTGLYKYCKKALYKGCKRCESRLVAYFLDAKIRPRKASDYMGLDIVS